MKNEVETRQIRLDAAAKTPMHIAMTGKTSRIEITVAHGVQATVVDTSTSDVHEIHADLAPESSLHIITLGTNSVRRCSSELGDGATIHWHCFTLGSVSSPHTLISTLNGRHAVSNVDWVFFVRGSDHQSVSVRNIFAAERGGGEITMKGVAEGHAYASCNGMIEITEQGGSTDTYLTEDVLMLDPTAKIDAVPGLEIRTNDVKASHSATVSRVTPEDLFYFRSRGITPETARKMYIDGFLGELTDRIPDEEVRKVVQKSLQQRASS